MENATKALFISAGVLMGVLILSLGIYLYYGLSSYITSEQERMEFNDISKFNAQFSKYVDTEVTLQDVITVANLAYENNLDTDGVASEYSNYVTVNAKINGGPKQTNIENKVNSDSSDWLNNNIGYTYTCTITMSNKTGRVIEINFD